MGIYLSDHDRDCLTNLRFADDVMLFATSKELIRKMMCDFKNATERVGLRIHPDETKILSNQSTINSDTIKHIEVGDMNIEIFTRNESVKYLGPTRDNRNQEPDQSSLGDFPPIQTRVDIKKYMLKHRLRSRNMDTEQGPRKNDSIDATQDATTHYPDKK